MIVSSFSKRRKISFAKCLFFDK